MRLAGIVVMALGVCVVAGGIVGLALDRKATSVTTAGGGPSSAAPSPSAATATSTPSPLETPQQFLDLHARALRSGDVGFLLGRLHPVVIARFGEDACRSAVTRLIDPTAAFTVKRVDPPAPYVYATDTRSTTVPATLAVLVDRVRQGKTSELTLHLTPVDSRLRWFTDCGLP
jgi:hypothetical protein